MNAEAFSLKARRTTRVPLRLPLQIDVEEGGGTITYDGWTLLVNIHGAKIQCKRRMQVGESILVRVPLTRKTQTGKVVWTTDVANEAGNFECAIELQEPGNLWGVGFPPSDWKDVKSGAGSAGVEIKPALSVVPPAAPAASVKPVAAGMGAAAEFDPRTIALPLGEMQPFPSLVSVPQAATKPLSTKEAMREPQLPAKTEMALRIEPTPAVEPVVAPVFAPVLEPVLEPVVAQVVAPVVEPVAELVGAKVVAPVVSPVFAPVVTPMVRSMVMPVREPDVAALEAKLAEVERASLERMERKLTAALEDHYERLDQHAESLAAAHQAELEQSLAKLATAAEGAARSRKQELASSLEQSLCHRANELTLQARDQMQRHATEAEQSVQSALADLTVASAARLQELLPAIEQEASARAQENAKQIHDLQRNQFEAVLASRIEDARAYWQEQMESVQEQAFVLVRESLQNHTEQQGKALMQRMDEGLAQLAGQIQQSFFRHVVAELSSQQQVYMGQARRDMNNLTDQTVHQVRRQLVQLLGAMGEALVREGQQPASPEVADEPPAAYTAADQESPLEMATQELTALQVSFDETPSVAQ